MAVNIEDAGFEIRDMIAWVYGSGFPKSLNIGKAVDKIQGNEREVTGTREVPDITGDAYGTMNDKQGGSYKPREIQDTKGTSDWEGWGTALKPALEPITVARKPISEKNIAQNILKHGTGGLNIDENRVEGRERTEYGLKSSKRSKQNTYSNPSESADFDSTKGRWPANLMHDGSDEVIKLFPEGDSGSAARFFYCAKASSSEREKGLEGLEKDYFERDNGYSSKISDTKRSRSNKHPTVKPIKLMKYLVALVTPKNGTVLDPFMGSGSTGIACKLNDFGFIGIDLDKEYCEIAEARIKAHDTDRQEKLL